MLGAGTSCGQREPGSAGRGECSICRQQMIKLAIGRKFGQVRPTRLETDTTFDAIEEAQLGIILTW